MPKTFTSTTFSNTYKDDYNDSAGYYKVLFNSGRALQARELNQLQTIVQEQIRRMADNIFLDGAAVDTSGAGVFTADYVILETSWVLENIYDMDELAAVGFVQDRVTKDVWQAANSGTDPLTPVYASDAELLQVLNVPSTN